MFAGKCRTVAGLSSSIVVPVLPCVFFSMLSASASASASLVWEEERDRWIAPLPRRASVGSIDISNWVHDGVVGAATSREVVLVWLS